MDAYITTMNILRILLIMQFYILSYIHPQQLAIMALKLEEIYDHHKMQLRFGLMIVLFITLMAVLINGTTGIPSGTVAAIWISFVCTILINLMTLKSWYDVTQLHKQFPV